MSDKPPTRADYNKMTPFQQGFCSYFYSAWPDSEVPNESHNPYPVSTPAHEMFLMGVQKAVQIAQDSEE